MNINNDYGKSTSRFEWAAGVTIGVLAIVLVSCIPGIVSLKKGPYVPVDLEDCFAYLDSTLPPETLDSIQAWPDSNMIMLHFGLGMWIRNEWGLWKGSRLSRWFNERGIYHPDDMSGIILDSYWRYRHAQPIDLDKQIRRYVQ